MKRLNHNRSLEDSTEQKNVSSRKSSKVDLTDSDLTWHQRENGIKGIELQELQSTEYTLITTNGILSFHVQAEGLHKRLRI